MQIKEIPIVIISIACAAVLSCCIAVDTPDADSVCLSPDDPRSAEDAFEELKDQLILHRRKLHISMENHDFQQAESLSRQILQLDQQIFTDKQDRAELVGDLQDMAKVQLGLGRCKVAEDYLRRALAAIKETQGSNKLLSAQTKMELSCFVSDPVEADALSKEGLAEARDCLPRFSCQLLLCLASSLFACRDSLNCPLEYPVISA